MKKKKVSSRVGIRDLLNPTTWMLPYGDLMTALLVFFIMLYAYSILGPAHFEKMVSVLQKEFGGKDVKQLETIKKVEKETEFAERMVTYLEEKELTEYAKVEINTTRIKISLANPVLYEIGSAELKPKAVSTLKEIVKYLQGLDASVIVEGHTDNIPIRGGKYRSNWELSAARAFSVIRYFIDSGIKPERLSTCGYGEYRPVAPNDTEENRAKNRRIEINIIREHLG